MKRTDVVAGLAGLVFALGLGVAGMTQPMKVAAFLDVTGAWDPSLALVMVGAIGVHFVTTRWKGPRPLFAARYDLPTATRVDARLLGGAALFGAGWGIAGYCPGPAIVSIASGTRDALGFAATMLAGMALYALFFARPKLEAPPAGRLSGLG